jgi:D-lactate dehydrogenase
MDALHAQLAQVLPNERIKSRLIDRVAYAADAGFYHLTPKIIVQPNTEAEVAGIFEVSQRLRIPMTFRTGGSSLSGQAITDGILVDLSQHWRQASVSPDRQFVTVQPGITGAMVNRILAPHGKKIGPDPSSISTAMMGGILSNNASGMCCGVVFNAYHTLHTLTFMLPNGKRYDTGNAQDFHRFKAECPELHDGLVKLRERILSNETLKARIRQKYMLKNTVGYALNAFLDYETPMEILAHLLIGAEGTLAFIAEAVLLTIPEKAHKSTALLFFPNMPVACQAIAGLTHAGADMIELMDRASLRAIEHIPGIPTIIPNLPAEAAALLVEFQGEDAPELERKLAAFDALPDLSLLTPAVFTRDANTRDLYWKIRKGMFPSVGAVRARGTTVLLEDIAVPVSQLAHAITDLQQLFTKYQYENAIIFGHAKDGNIHFVVTQSFHTPEEIQRYKQFMDEVVDMVVHRYDGSLKAEHGTGRNMAPFVETEWGGEAYAIMKELKTRVDPNGLLNPGVIINDHPEAHIQNLKEMPVVEAEVDTCIECGYCEHICPSRDLTLTPRRRIVVRRAIAGMKAKGDHETAAQLVRAYQYDGLDTCAVDGLCASECPVDINTGDLVKRLRRENHSDFQNRLALQVAKHFRATEWTIRTALRLGVGMNQVFGALTMTKLTGALQKIWSGAPRWMPTQTGPVTLPKTNAVPDAIYFATCITRSMGADAQGSPDVVSLLVETARKVGLNIHIPAHIHGRCCGQPFSSKGFQAASTHMKTETVRWLWQQSDGGRLPIILDMSSCTHTLLDARPFLDAATQQQFDQLRLLDSVDYLHDYVLPKAKFERKKEAIALHPVCSLTKMKNKHKLLAIARACAEQVHTPLYANCCGMAGDRGMTHPALTAAATAMEAAELQHTPFAGYYASSKTCEMALSEATQANYQSIAMLMWETMQ